MLLFTPSLRQCGPGLTLHNEALLTHGSQTVAQVPTGVLVGKSSRKSSRKRVEVSVHLQYITLEDGIGI